MNTRRICVDERNGTIDWTQMKESGVQFAMLRAGYGKGNIDVQFRKNAEGCVQSKIPFGVYWFSYAYTADMAREEAELCAETIEEYCVESPVYFVYAEEAVRYAKSRGAAVGEKEVSSIVSAFCRRMEELGYSAAYCEDLSLIF